MVPKQSSPFKEAKALFRVKDKEGV